MRRTIRINLVALIAIGLAILVSAIEGRSQAGVTIGVGNTTAIQTNSVGPVFNVQNSVYGAKANYRTVSDAVCSNSANTWSSATLNVSQGDVGKIFWARPSANQTTITTSAGTGALSQFTIASVIDSSHWTSTNNTGSSNCGASMFIGMGSDNGTVLQAAWAAAGAAPTGGVIYIPCGDYAVGSAFFTGATSGIPIAVLGGGPSGTTSGVAQACTRIHVSPGVGWGTSSTVINMASNTTFRDLGFEGDQMTVPAVTSASFMVWSGVSRVEDVSFNNFFTASNSNTLTSITGDDAMATRMFVSFTGGIAYSFHSLNANFFDCIFIGSPAASLADWGSIATFVGGALINANSGAALDAAGISGGGIGASFIGTTFTAGNNSTPLINVSGNNISMRLVAPVMNNGGTNTVNLLTVASGSTVTLSGMELKGAGTGMTITNSGTLVDGGGNNMTNVIASGAITTPNGSRGIGRLCAAVGTGASPSVAACGNSTSGLFSCATNAVTTCTVNTSSVTGGSMVAVQQDTSAAAGTALGVTCNVTPNVALVSAKSAGASFSVTITQPVVNPACYSYNISN